MTGRPEVERGSLIRHPLEAPNPCEGMTAVTTPRLESETAAERLSEMRIDARALCAEFVERIVSEARREVAQDLPGVVPDVDWAQIWAAGDGAPSVEIAVGRIVRAAYEAARGLSRPQTETPVAVPPVPRVEWCW